MSSEHVSIFRDDFCDRLIKLAVSSDIDLHVEVSTLLRNLSFHPKVSERRRLQTATFTTELTHSAQFANQLRDRGAM